MEEKKMFAIIKNCNYDFNIDIKVCAVTDDEDTAKTIFEKEVENIIQSELKNEHDSNMEIIKDTYETRITKLNEETERRNFL